MTVQKFRNFQMVSKVVFGRGSFNQAGEILDLQRAAQPGAVIFLVDAVFEGKALAGRIPSLKGDAVIFTNVDDHEPKTTQVDALRDRLQKEFGSAISGVVGIGGGSVMDISKAVSVMLTNPGSSADYQGWDLPKKPSVYHAGIPTLSGTGAEVSRTTVLTGPVRKLGINSDYSVFHQIILDPDLIADAPAEQRFYTGMDCYIHCVESLEGTFLNSFSRAYGQKALELCEEVFLGEVDRQRADDDLMMASYCGGMSIAYSQVGVCHALSYGLGFVLGVRHGIGNSIVFDYLDEFYPKGVDIFRQMCAKNAIELPRKITANLTDAQMEKMLDVALSLEPLWENALGKGWKDIMTRQKARSLYERM
ncbi:MAG: iron-containing alcohol dehydrogenase family protein [Desulfatibacillaceae bacterium]|nr:iron-containing alcohol dehydrogenase family protein [Desulfatibacillaceae bacterium]